MKTGVIAGLKISWLVFLVKAYFLLAQILVRWVESDGKEKKQ